MPQRTTARETHSQRGVISWARRYDLLVSLITLGRERRLRERILDRAPITVGDVVLDIGCGTGTLAVAAARRVGPGLVYGIDPSPQMIARAHHKANRAAARAAFVLSRAEALPFANATIDVVLSTVMLHHMNRVARTECMREVARVLATGGHILAVDFGSGQQRGFLAHFHRHSRFNLADLVAMQTEAGLEIVDAGPLGIGPLLFVLGKKTDGGRGHS